MVYDQNSKLNIKKSGDNVRINWDDYMAGRKSSWTDMELLEKYAAGNILEIGCGSGSLVSKLKDRGSLYAIDVTDEFLDNAQNRFSFVKFLKSPGEQTPFEDEHFNLVFAIEVVEHLPDPEKMFREVKRILKSGGIFIFQTPNYPVKRIYDIIYFFYRKGYKFADDSTHITKKPVNWWKGLSRKHFEIIQLKARNLMFENIIKSPERFKYSPVGLKIGQKIIYVLRKK